MERVLLWLTIPARAVVYLICMTCGLAAGTWWLLVAGYFIQIVGIYTRVDVAGNRDHAVLDLFKAMPAWVIVWICCIFFGVKIAEWCIRFIEWLDTKV
jgi:hypothetical protein